MTIKFLDTFAGIGGVRMGLEQALNELGIDHQCVGTIEYDKNPCKTYSNNFEKVDPTDITKVDIKSLPNFDMLLGGFPCFKEGTMILTKDGYKDIKDIEVGDYVLTHTNNYRKVLNKMITPNKKGIYKLKIQGILDTYATNEHPYYVISKLKNNTYTLPYWKNVENLEKGDLIGINLFNTYTKDYSEKLLGKEDIKFYKLIGRLIADGWWGKYSRGKDISSKSNRVVLCCNKNEVNEVEILINGLYNYSKVEERTVFKFHIVNKELLEFLENFGKYSYGKKIPIDFLGLDKKYLKSFLDGYIDGDGHTFKEGRHRVSSVSKELILGIQLIVYKLFMNSSPIGKIHKEKTKIIENRLVNQRDYYTLIINENNIKTKGYISGKYIWMPFKSKKYLDEINTVYNIEVEGDNSYTANNAIVHNCQSFSINGKWYVKNSCTLGNDERNNLVFYLFEILKEKNPKYFLFENVKELTTIKNLDGTLFFDTIKENLNGLGYNVYTNILDTNDFGVPQQRKKVFLLGIRKDIDKKGYKFPQGNNNITCIKDILQDDSEIDEKYYLDVMWKNRTCSGGGNKPELKGRNRLDVLKELYGTGKWEQAMNLNTPSGKIEPISIIYGDTPSNLARQGDKIYSIYGIAPTIATFSVSIPKVNTKRWRQITPRECMRLQGFPDSYKIDKNDTLAYKQAGNSVSVPVIKELILNLFK